MASIYRVTAEWTGWAGGPGYTNLYFRNVDGTGGTSDAQGRVRTFFASFNNALPDEITVQVLGEVAVLDDATGEVQEFIANTPPAPVQGEYSGPYSSATGACITWLTSGVRNGRRVRGRTFIVPLGAPVFGPDGTLADPGALQTIANNLLNPMADDMVVWSRPGMTASGPQAGASFDVVGARVRDMAAVLRSRRD